MNLLRVKTYNTIQPSSLVLLPVGSLVGPDVTSPDVILLRSYELLPEEIEDSVLAVGRAGTGVDNIPHVWLRGRGVPVFNTPGVNANAVAEMVLVSLVAVYRQLRPAQRFVHDLDPNDSEYRTKAEAAKGRFAGNEIRGKTIGVVGGLGAIGKIVVQWARSIGLYVIVHDQHQFTDPATGIVDFTASIESFNDLLRRSDIVSLHIPLVEESIGLIGAAEFALMKPGVVLLNFAREELVDPTALLAALEGDLRHYATDFPMPEIHCHPKVSATPHIGASTAESEEACSNEVVQRVLGYLDHGEIRNAVNFPAISLEHHSPYRLMVLHANKPMMSAQITSVIGRAGLNIEANIDTTSGESACSLLDLNGPVTPKLSAALQAIDGVYRVRYIYRN